MANIIFSTAVDSSGAEKGINALRAKASAPLEIKFNSRSLSQPLGRITGDVSEFTKSLSAATARVAAFGATSGAIYAVAKAISFTAKSVVEVDKELIELNTFLGVSTSQIKQFGNSLFDVAKDTASSFKDTASAAKEFARQGLSMEETLKRTSDALKLSRISGLSAEESVNALTTAVNSFSKEALTTSEIINKLINVDTKFAVSSKDLAEAISRVGSTAQESGVGIDQLNAAVTSAQQTTGRGGAVIGNALKTIFSRLRRPEVIDQLKDLGVAVKDQNGFLLNGIDVLKNYVAATQNLTEAEKAKSSEILGGIHQINVLNSLLNDVSKSNGIYARSLDASVNSTDEAIKKNEKLNESLSAILQKTSVLAQQKAVQYGTPVVQPLVQRGTAIANKAFELLGGDSAKDSEKEGGKIGEGLLRGVGNVLAGPGLILAGGIVLNIGKRLSSFLIDASKVLLNITTQSDKLLTLEQAISNTLKSQPALLDQFLKGEISRESLEQGILNLYKDQYEKLRQIKEISSTLAPKGRLQGYEATADYGVIKKKGRASGYLPDGFSQEVSQARSMGASSLVKPMVVNATINGKTGPVIANSEEQIIPNFAGTGETAIIPNYRQAQDIPRMAKGYVPNFANADRSILRDVISINRLNMSTDEFADPAKNGMSSVLHRGVSGISKRWKKIDRNDPEAVKKAIFTQIDYSDEVPGYDPKKAFMGSSFESLVDSHRSDQLSSTDLSGYPKPRKNGYNNSLPFLSTSKTGDAARSFSSNGLGLMGSVKFRNSRILGNEKLYESLYAKYGKNKVREVLYRQSQAGGGKGLGLDFNDAYRKSSGFEHEREVGLFSGGRLPNFAKGRDVIQRIGKKEIFARFQKHYEQGKDYQEFYNIHGEEFNNRKLTAQEAKIYANITSAISPSVPDYVAAQFAAPIFNRFMQTRSTNVEDYFDLAPSKKVSRHKNVFGLGLFGVKGTLSKKGNIRTRDDIRRSGLSKALRGLDLGSDDTAKTRHYARAILQDKTAFPIDTNVIKAVLGGKKPSKTEAAKLVSLANEFAILNKIETGASGLQAAIFKSNSKYKGKYTPDTVRSSLSGIGGRAGGYVPSFGTGKMLMGFASGSKPVNSIGEAVSKAQSKNIGEDTSAFSQVIRASVYSAVVGVIPSLLAGYANEKNVGAIAEISRITPIISTLAQSVASFRGAGRGKAGLAAGALTAVGNAPSIISGFAEASGVSQRVREEKLQKEIDKSIKQFTLLTENLSGLSQTLTSLDEAYSDPNIDPRIIAKLFKKQQDQLEKTIKANPAAASSIVAAGTAKQKQQALADTLEESSKQQNVSGKIFEYQSADPKKQTTTAFQGLIDGIISQIDTSKISKENLKSGDIKTILASAGLDKNPQAKSLFSDPKVADYFGKALGVSKKISDLTEKLISDTKEIRKPVQALINSNESKRTIRTATSEALSSGLDSIEKFSSSFGERANISAGRDVGLAKKQIALDSRFQIGSAVKISAAPEGAFKESLKKDIQGKAFSPELLATLNKTLPENASPKDKEVFDQIKGLLEEILREDETNTKVANAQTSVQLKTLAIQERLTFGGGIKTSTDAGARVDSAKQTLRGALQYQLGGTMGSSATQTAGLTNFAANLKDKYPGLLEGSKSINGIEKKLTDLKFNDLRKSLLRDARTASSIGQGGLAGDLLKGFNDIPGLRKIANTQARQGLGLAPKEIGESISEARQYGRYSSEQRARESESVANAEKGIEPQVAPKNEVYQKAVKDLQDSLSNALSGLGEIKINGNPVINISGNASGTSTLGNLYQQAKSAVGLDSGEVTQAKGFIPNFASPLQDAVNREKSALSKRGIDAVPNFAKINVGQSSKLMNGSNPMGLAVTNSVDEPRGLASIGLASGGYVPNFARTLYGERKASAGLALAKKGKLWAMEYNQDEPNRFFRILENGRIGAEGSPSPTDRVISGFPVNQGKAFLKLGSGKSIPKSLEASLAGGSILETTGIDGIIRAVKRKGGTAADLRNEIEALAQKQGLGSGFVIKTGLGGMSSQGKGVFGVPKQALNEEAYEQILKSYGKKGNKSSDFFIQRKANLSQDYTESRIHVAIDKKGNVTLVKNASLEKHKAGLVEDSAFRRAAEKTALQTGKAFAKKNRGIQQILGVDVSAVSSIEGARLGLKTPIFGGFFGRTYQTLAHEINPSDPLGSSGFLSVQNAFSEKFSGVAKGNTLEQFVRGILGTHNQIEIQEHLDKRSRELAYGEALRQGEGRASGRSDYDQIMRKARKAGLTEEQIAKNLSRGRSSFLGALETSKPDISRDQFKTAFKTGSFDKGVYEAYKAAIASGDLEKASQITSGSKAPPALSSKIGGGLSKLSKLTDKIPSSVRKFGGVGFQGLGVVGQGLEAYEDAGKGDLFGTLAHGVASATFGLGALGNKMARRMAGPIAPALSGYRLVEDILKAKNNSIASEWSDIPFGSKDQTGGRFSGAVESGLNLLTGGAAGRILETAKIGYRTGNVIENKLGIGESMVNEASMNLQASRERAPLEALLDAKKRKASRIKLEADSQSFFDRLHAPKKTEEAAFPMVDLANTNKLNQGDRIAALRKQSADDSLFLSFHAEKGDREEAARRGVSLEKVIKEREDSKGYTNESKGFVPNFSFAREKMSIMSSPDYAGHRNAVPNYSKHYSNVIKNSAEIEVPASEVYNRMGLFGAKPKNSSEQYAILNPAQQKSLGYAQGFVPNFAGNDFMEKLSTSIKEAISSAFEGGMPQGNSNSNVVHINDNSTYHGASQVGSIKKFLMDQFPKELGKYGPDFLAS